MVRRFLPSALVLALVLEACSSSTDPVAPADAGADSAVAVEHDDPCGPDPTGPAAALVPSTRVATVKAKKGPVAEASKASPVLHEAMEGYLAQGLGDWEPGPAEPGMVNDTLLPGAGPSATATGRKSVAFIAHLSDTQLADDESPTRVLKLDNPAVSGAGRPQEASVGLATSAMHRTLAEITKSRKFDFEIVTGDCIDSAQENEIGWFVDLMDGKIGLHLDSGEDDDPVIGPSNDPKDPFDPHPAPAPWYFVFGNHDVEIQGTATFDEGTVITATGDEPRNGTRDYRKKWAPPTQELIPPDARRRPVTRGEIVMALQKGTGTPAGHGFAGVTVSGAPANYVVDPIAGVPIRLVQLDTNDPFGGSDGLVYQKTIDEFLEPTLAKADADGVLVIMSSHHASTEINPGKGLEPDPVPGAVTSKVLEDAVAKHPSVVLWLVGHDHRNRVRPIAGPSTSAPGYYEVMTSAIADWPAQSRAIELVYVPASGATPPSLAMFLTIVDFQTKTCLEDRFRRWALVDVNSKWSPDGSGTVADRNVELRRALPPNVKLEGLGKDKIETETTLLGK